MSGVRISRDNGRLLLLRSCRTVALCHRVDVEVFQCSLGAEPAAASQHLSLCGDTRQCGPGGQYLPVERGSGHPCGHVDVDTEVVVADSAGTSNVTSPDGAIYAGGLGAGGN